MPDFIPPKSQDTKPVRVELPKEPPKEVLEQTFTLDDLPKNDSVAAPVQLPTRNDNETPKTKEPVKSDERPRDASGKFIEVSGEKRDIEGQGVSGEVHPKGDKTNVQQEVSQVLKPPQPKDKKVEGAETAPKKQDETVKLITPQDKSQKKERDYSGFSNEETAVLKQMSNEAFDYASRLVKDNKELSKLKDGNYLQHPEAYKLSPDYQQTLQQVQMANIEGDAWRKALIECKAGKNFKVPTGFNKQTGELVYSAEHEPSEASEVELSQVLNNVSRVSQELQGRLGTMGESFKQRTTNDLQVIQSERQKRFAWVAKPEMMDWTVSTVSGDIPIKQVKTDFTNLFPPYMRNSPGVEVASDLFVAMLIQDAELKNALAGKSSVEAKIDEVKRGEPSSEAVQREAFNEVNGVKEFSTNGMPR